MKTLVIAEKPSVARDLAQVLRPGTRKSPDRLEAEDMVFTWALGHLLSLEDAEG
ncbi:MAG: toprim domain-containing protein, partial [Sulfobacillus thermotolerans]|nr:toprim domain-containing protein [Sulfobacillus thermotolerans]